MSARSLLTTIACFLFCAFLQFGGTLVTFPWVLVAGGICAAVFLSLLRFFEVELPRSWLPVPLASGASLAGVLPALPVATMSQCYGGRWPLLEPWRSFRG